MNDREAITAEMWICTAERRVSECRLRKGNDGSEYCRSIIEVLFNLFRNVKSSNLESHTTIRQCDERMEVFALFD